MLNYQDVEQVFQALGDPTRRKLMQCLSRGPLPLSNLVKPLGISLAAVVQHVQVLERSSLVKTQKQGRVRLCEIDPAGLNLIDQWVQQHRALWERRLDRLGDILAEEALWDPQTDATEIKENRQ